MRVSEEMELLRLSRENNVMLRKILQYLKGDNTTDFIGNIVANLIANKMENR